MVQMIWPLIVLLWTVTTEWTRTTTTAAEVEKQCPSACRCYRQSAGDGDIGGIHSIVCSGAGLPDIPQSFDFYAQILNFTGNRLVALTNESFGSAHLQRLEIVDLSANDITMMTRDALSELKNLLELDLSDNRIETIRAPMFRNNRFLNTIRLSGNPIKALGERAFPLSVYLRTLHFQGCQLKRIHRYTFFSTPLLEHLNLKDNALESPPMAVLQLTQLRTLQLDGNPCKCDRRLRRVLRWLRSRNGDGNQSLSLLCVFGETQNAIFWDTMEVGNGGGSNFKNFQNLTVGGGRGHHPRRNHRKRRRRSDRGRDKRAINTSSHKAHIARHHKTSNVGGGDIFESEPEWMNIANSHEQLPSGLNFSYTVPFNCSQHYEYSPTRFLKNHYPHPRNKTKTILAPASAINAIAANATVIVAPNTMPMAGADPSHPVYHNAKVARNYVEHPPSSQRESRIDTNEASTLTQRRLPSSTIENGQYDEAEVGGSRSDESFIEQNHAIILAGEMVLIVILLIILYHLWKENRKRVRSADAAATAETGVNFPLNNGGARVKSYDTQTNADAVGYRRYSLSDEEYSNIRNGNAGAGAVDEGKYDAESGYLSYHRYNSVEGDNPSTNECGGDIDVQPNNRCGNGAGATAVVGGDTRVITNFRRCNSTSSRRGRTHELQHLQHLANSTVDSKAIDTRPISDRIRAHSRSRSSFSDSDDNDDDDHDRK